MAMDRTKSLKSLLIFGGLWLSYPNSRYGFILTTLQIIRYLYLAIGWSMIIISLVYGGIGFLLTPTAVFMPLGLQITVTTATIFAGYGKIHHLIKESERNINTYAEDWEKDIIDSHTRIINLLAKVLNYGLLTFGATYIVLPVLLDLVRVAMGYSEPYIVPLPLGGYLDEEKERNLWLYCVIIASDVWFMFAVPNTIAYECLIIYIVSYTTSEIKIVIEHLRKLYDPNDDGVGLLSDWNLRYIIKKHEQIVRLNRLQREYVTLPYMCQSVCATLSFCFVMYFINQVMGKDSVLTVLGIIFIILLLGAVSVMCSAGEYLEEMSMDLFYEICNLPWYRQRPQVRKNILIMLMESSRPLVLDYGGHFSLNLRAYMQIINTAYSYYMLMKSVT